jgi:uncharacterized protein (DUF1800 family)
MWVMTPFAIGVVAGVMFLQASIAAPRQNFTDCLKKASQQAVTQQVAPDQYSVFAAQQCAASAAGLKAALIAFDAKNGVKRGKAAADAQLQVDDYVATSAEKYESKATFAKAKTTPAPAVNVTPAPVPAAVPKSN